MSETDKPKRRIPLWPFFFCVLPIVVGIGLVLLINQPEKAGNAPGNNGDAATSAIPSLGSRGHPLDDPVQQPANEPEDNPEPADPDQTQPEDEPEDEPEVVNTAREIDIWLNNLALATRTGNRKSMKLHHEMLEKARPHELVDERVENALLNETNAWVRIQFFKAFHEIEPRVNWAMNVYDTRTAKFLGTDKNFSDGELDELRLLAGILFSQLVNQWRDDATPNERVMALLRSVLNSEKPEWLLEETRHDVFLEAIRYHVGGLVKALEQEIRNLLQRKTAEREIRETLFVAFILTFDPVDSVLVELELAEWRSYASELATWYLPRQRPTGQSGWPVEWLDKLLAGDEVPQLFERLLQSDMAAEEKRLLIQRIADYDVPNGRKVIEEGLDRRDENYPDYLTALGSFANSEADLQRLTTAAGDMDVAIAQGAIEGLRQSGLSAADTELRKVLEQGANLGVKSQALGALLSRATEKEELLEEYLSENKDSSLRAVAVAHIPEDDMARLMRVVEEDGSPRVRQAALNRLGAMQPTDSRTRKELYGFFTKIRQRDDSPVIRAAARKYADAIKD